MGTDSNAQLVHISMSACEKNHPDQRVALYLDESMVYKKTGCFLPVMNIEKSGLYAEFVPVVRESVSQFFGTSYPDAEVKVREINAARGMEHDEVILMVAESMGVAGDRLGRY